MSGRAGDRLGTAAVLGVVALLVVFGWLRRERIRPVAAGDEAPGFELPSLSGERVALEDLRGRVVVLNVWATWCAPCRREMPALDRLQRELGPAGVEVVAVSVDAAPGRTDRLGRPGGDVRAFVEELGLDFLVLLDPRASVQDRYGVTGLPTTYVIGRDGRIARKVVGPAAWDEPPYSTLVRELAKG